MPRIQPLSLENAGEARPLLEGVQKKLGKVPNIYATMAHSPAALDYTLTGSQKLGQFKLDAKLREQVALAIAGVNGCDYCASAHTAVGKGLGLSDQQTGEALERRADDPKAKAAIDLATAIVEKRGWVTDQDVQAFRDAGFGDRELVEIVHVVVHNVLTNYFNHLNDTTIDFPEVRTPQAAAT